jgi:hypothetical protein
MKRNTLFSTAIGYVSLCVSLCASVLALSSCYSEPNPLNSIAAVGAPVAIVRTLTATPTNPAAGGMVTATVTYSTLESPVSAVNLYAQVGTAARTQVATTAVSVAPSPNRVTQTLTYTIPANTPRGTIILLVAGVTTAGGESFSGSGVRNAVGTITITVN